MRSAPLLLLTLAACTALQPSKSFASIGDLRTTHPRHLAEGGHGSPVAAPTGLRWSTTLVGYAPPPTADDVAARGSGYYEMRLRIVDAGAQPGTWRARPVLERIELADDEGNRFRCERASIPDERAIAAAGGSDPDRVAIRHYTFFFDLPSNYRFRTILHATVHWTLALGDGRVLEISSRFRA